MFQIIIIYNNNNSNNYIKVLKHSFSLTLKLNITFLKLGIKLVITSINIVIL